MATRSYWGWGEEEAAVAGAERAALMKMLGTRFDTGSLEELTPLPIGDVVVPASRIRPPDGLEVVVDQPTRAAHTYGKAYRDLVRALRGDFTVAPDAVAYPKSAEDVVAILAWCEDEGYAAIPFGGGSSVVGGVEARCRDAYPGVVTLDLRDLCGVRRVDEVSRAALIDAGSYGPAIEQALAPHGLTLRHYPQSFEFSTLGGWLATRAGGHYATLYTHIDDLTESMTVVTLAGTVETRRLPASGAGPSPDRLFLGSEGSLGIIVRAWMRLVPRPTFRASANARFDDFYAAARAARDLAQSGLYPSNCRLLDPFEALLNGVGHGAFLLIAFESADHPVDTKIGRAVELVQAAGGEARVADSTRAGAAGRWREMFLRGPYLRDALVTAGVVVETFETAITWDRFESFHRALMETGREVLQRICGAGEISSRITHVYPDGAAPYFTVIAPGKAGGQLEQWDEIKAAVSEAIIDAGGTITHHHAVGRDHRPWYDRQRPALFGDVLRAAKRTLDPRCILNPGVLV